MNWNDDQKSPSSSLSSESRILPKLGNLSSKKKNPKNLLMSKSSMMGVLGVVPEENDSEQDDGHIKYTTFSQINTPATKKLSNATKKCTKRVVEYPKFYMISAIVQAIYVVVALIYFFIIIDVYNDNIIAITSALLALNLIIFTFYALVLVGKGCKTKLAIEFIFLIVVIIIEISDMSVRLQSGFNDDKDSQGNKSIFGAATILRVFMVHRR